MCLNPWPIFFRPVHWSNVKRGIFIESAHSFSSELDPCLDWDNRLQEKFFGRIVDTRAVKVKVRSDAFEGPGAIEHYRAKPGCVGARPHDRHVALTPFSLEKCPGFRPIASDSQSRIRSLVVSANPAVDVNGAAAASIESRKARAKCLTNGSTSMPAG